MAPKRALLLVLCVALLQLTQARVKQTHHSHRAHVHVSHHRHPHPHARAHAANPAVLREREFESGGNYGVEQAHIGGTQEQPMLLEEDVHLYGGDRGQRAMHAAERHLSRADQRMEQYDMPQQEQQQQQRAMYAQQQAPPQPRFQQVQQQMPTLSFDGAPAMTAGPTLQQNAAPSLGDQLMAHAQSHNAQAASFGHTALQLPPLPPAYPARQQLANNAAVPPIFLEAQNLPPPPDVSNIFSSSEWASPAGMAAAPPFQQGAPSPFQAPPALMPNAPVMLEQQATFRAAPGPMQFPQMAMQPAVPQMAPQPPSFAPAAPAYNSAQFASSITQPRFMETYADAVTGPYGNALEDPYYDAQTLARANAPMMPMQASMPQQQQSQNKGMPVPPAMPDLPPPPVGIY